MTRKNQETAVSAIVNLLKLYSFESGQRSHEKNLEVWLKRFPLNWVKLALVESLYQGRYKAISVEQILALWQRRGEPCYHFTHDFERLVSHNLPQDFSAAPPVRQRPMEQSSQSDSYRSRRHVLARLQALGDRIEPGNAEIESVDSPAANDSESLNPEDFSPTRPAGNTTLPAPLESSPETLGSSFGQEWDEPVLPPSQEAKHSRAPQQECPSQAGGLFPEPADFEKNSVAPDLASSTFPETNDLESKHLPISEPLAPKPLLLPPESSLRINPIHQFVPQSGPSGFYSKLTAMVQQRS
ncbi:hypothetical protein [Lyngbya confervoides]|uniref:Uncharacterized protein n=1 Tax=Lyngbya confervoides BDU141951 TaxID=1574623 RepID=A0ABD4T706_9CYAN|nr:hypothetical protein [Lyngbya confervoides]MCM1984527.1 hypothetical protein [Lyngbya confervoides BDU141951]